MRNIPIPLRTSALKDISHTKNETESLSISSWKRQQIFNIKTTELHTALTLINGGFVLCMALYVLRKPLIELFMGIKQCWHDKMQQGPQLKAEERTVDQQISPYCGQGNWGS